MRKEEIEQQENKCFYCDCVIYEFSEVGDCDEMKTKEHIIPASKKGRNSKENIVFACKKCNGERGNSDLFDFLNSSNNDFTKTQIQKLISYVQNKGSALKKQTPIVSKKKLWDNTLINNPVVRSEKTNIPPPPMSIPKVIGKITLPLSKKKRWSDFDILKFSRQTNGFSEEERIKHLNKFL